MKISVFIAFFLSLTTVAWSQQSIRGNVFFADNNKPVAAASVFFSNTSFGTVTDADGSFSFSGLPGGRLDLIVSFIGYETIVQPLDIARAGEQPLAFYLKPKPKELQEVSVGGYELQTWEKWGKFFLDNFLGSSVFAVDCRIKNTDKITFRFYKKRNELHAVADEDLIIINEALGYTLRYKLELFTYNFKKKLLQYEGYPLFEPMTSKRSRKQERWLKNRQTAYEGSVMHFMRSLYRNQTIQESFEIRRMRQDTNYEKRRVQSLLVNRIRVFNNGNQHQQVISDSASYYDRISRQPDLIDRYSSYTLTGDSIAYAADSTTAALQFSNFLYITYTRGLEEQGYVQNVLGNSRPARAPASTLAIVNDSEVFVLANGYHYNSLSLLNSGYWGWSEKIGNMLPLDYTPIRQPEKLP